MIKDLYTAEERDRALCHLATHLLSVIMSDSFTAPAPFLAPFPLPFSDPYSPSINTIMFRLTRLRSLPLQIRDRSSNTGVGTFMKGIKSFPF